MPIYEYFCESCKSQFEKLVFGDEAPQCPRCNEKNVKRVMSACGFVSKGGSGEVISRSAGASSCTGCSATSCAGCGQ